jgi:putative membrane protein
MKAIYRTSKIMTVFIAACTWTACQNNEKTERSKEAAKDINDERFETRESEKKADFLVEAIAANMAEIEVARLAISQSKNEDIKSMARQLEKDHHAILSELKSFASEKGVSVPSELSDADSRQIQSLREEKTGDFDKKLLRDLESRHSSSIKKYEKCVESSDDLDLKNMAGKQLVTIRAHDHMIEKLLDKY